MDDTSAGAGLGRPLLVFALWLIAGQAILVGLDFAFPKLNIPDSINLVVTIVAALNAGKSFAGNSGRTLSGGEAWRFALSATLIALALVVVSIVLLFWYFEVPLTREAINFVFAGGDRRMIRVMEDWGLVIIAAGILVTFGVCYGGAVSGAKSVIRKREKAAGRG